MLFSKESIKNVSIVFIFISLLIGTTFITIGLIYYYSFTALDTIFDSWKSFYAAPILIIVIGFLLNTFAACGCLGIYYKNRCILTIYSIVLIIILLVQLSVFILLSIISLQRESLSKTINDSVGNIFLEKDADFIEMLQTGLHCCGSNSMKFWNETMQMPFPQSCCEDDTCVNMIADSCQFAVYYFVDEAFYVMKLATSCFSIFQVLEIAAIFLLSYKISKEKQRLSGYNYIS